MAHGTASIARADSENGALLATFPTRMRPLRAIIAMARFLANKEDTKQVVIIFDAIDGPQNERNFQRYCEDEAGRRMLEEAVDYSKILMQSDMLRQCPPGSLGAAYIEFTDAEQIDAQGLETAQQQAKAELLRLEPNRRRFIASGIALHDLWHVLTGYGRDALGEACVIGFSAAQANAIGLSGFALSLALREQLMFPRVPVMRCLAESRRIGRSAKWLPVQDWRALFDQPLDEIRKKLNIERPVLYDKHAAYVREIDKVRRERLAKRKAA